MAATVVTADMPLTRSAVILQPITGSALMMLSATSLGERWLVASIALYAIAWLFWIPIVFTPIEMWDLACIADAAGQALPVRNDALFRRWSVFGMPGLGSVPMILWLMIVRPDIQAFHG
jgi:uncharacterized membrane protein